MVRHKTKDGANRAVSCQPVKKDHLKKCGKSLVEPSSFSILHRETPMDISEAEIGSIIEAGKVSAFHIEFTKRGSGESASEM